VVGFFQKSVPRKEKEKKLARLILGNVALPRNNGNADKYVQNVIFVFIQWLGCLSNFCPIDIQRKDSWM
jgi:hypothetical protein